MPPATGIGWGMSTATVDPMAMHSDGEDALPERTPDADDQDLRAFQQHHERQRLSDLWQRNLDESWRLARWISGHRAEDALQDAALGLVMHAGRWRDRGPGSARAWLLRIVVNAARKQRRRDLRAWQPLTAVGAVTEHPTDTESEAMREVALAALGRLAARYRQALELRYLAGLDFTAVAAALAVPERTARTRVARGLDLLRQRLGVPATPGAASIALAMTPSVWPAPPAGAAHLVSAAPPTATALSAGTAMTVAGAVLTGSAALAVITGATLWTRPAAPQPVEPQPVAAVAVEPQAQPPVAQRHADLLARTATAWFHEDALAEVWRWFRPLDADRERVIDLAAWAEPAPLSLPYGRHTLREVLDRRCADGSAIWTATAQRLVVQVPLDPSAIAELQAQLAAGDPPLASLSRLGSLDLWRAILARSAQTPSVELERQLRWLPSIAGGDLWQEDPAVVAALATAITRTDVAEWAQVRLLQLAAWAGAGQTAVTEVLDRGLLATATPTERRRALALLEPAFTCALPAACRFDALARLARQPSGSPFAAALLMTAMRQEGLAPGRALTLAQDQTQQSVVRMIAALMSPEVNPAEAEAWSRLRQDPAVPPAVRLAAGYAEMRARQTLLPELVQPPAERVNENETPSEQIVKFLKPEVLRTVQAPSALQNLDLDKGAVIAGLKPYGAWFDTQGYLPPAESRATWLLRTANAKLQRQSQYQVPVAEVLDQLNPDPAAAPKPANRSDKERVQAQMDMAELLNNLLMNPDLHTGSACRAVTEALQHTVTSTDLLKTYQLYFVFDWAALHTGTKTPSNVSSWLAVARHPGGALALAGQPLLDAAAAACRTDPDPRVRLTAWMIYREFAVRDASFAAIATQLAQDSYPPLRQIIAANRTLPGRCPRWLYAGNGSRPAQALPDIIAPANPGTLAVEAGAITYQIRILAGGVQAQITREEADETLIYSAVCGKTADGEIIIDGRNTPEVNRRQSSRGRYYAAESLVLASDGTVAIADPNGGQTVGTIVPPHTSGAPQF